MANGAHCQIRFPVDPLHALVHDESTTGLAEQLGIPGRTILRWKAEGGVPERTADRVAQHLGMHPSNIWSEWYEATAHPERRVLA